MNIPILEVEDAKDTVKTIPQGIFAIDNIESTTFLLSLMQYLYIQDLPVIMCVEKDFYYKRMFDREPIIPYEEKENLWRHILPKGSILVPIPLKLFNYDTLAKGVGAFKSKKLFHLIVQDCNIKERKVAQRRAGKGMIRTFLPITIEEEGDC